MSLKIWTAIELRRKNGNDSHLELNCRFLSMCAGSRPDWGLADPAVALACTHPALRKCADCLGIFAKQGFSGTLHCRQHVGVAHQVRDSQVGETGLPGTQQLAG